MGGDDDAARRGQHAGEIGIGQLLAHLHFGGSGGRPTVRPADDALIVDIAAAAELAGAQCAGGVGLDVRRSLRSPRYRAA